MKTKLTTRRQMLKQSLICVAGASLALDVLTGVASATENEHTPAGNFHSAISTPDPEALAAAAPILQQGGNAVDAAVAALTALCVVQPNNVGFAGYGGSTSIYLAKTSRVFTIDFDSRAPLAFRPETFTEQNANYGYLAPGVPGIMAGLDLALRKYGTLSWKTVSRHAFELADQGFIVGPELKQMFNRFGEHADKKSIATFFPDGNPPAEGERWVQKDLARVISEINEGGGDAFYCGDIARRIVKHLQENGGILTDEDFGRFHAQEVAPLRINYRGHQFYTPPVPSAGLTSFGILKTLENFDLAPLEPWGPQYFHLFAQASKLCWKERLRLFGDPDFVKFSAEELLSNKLGAARAEKIRLGKIPPVKSGPREPQHTVNVVVIDKHQNIVSLTATHGGDFGSRVVVPGTGLVLGHGMSRFAFKPGPNFPAPGKRMQHNMAPMVVLRGGKPWAGIGMAGARTIVTVTPQLAIDVIDFKTTSDQAIKAPRIHIEGEEPLKINSDVSDSVATGLESLGHKVERLPGIGGVTNVAVIDPASGKIDAASGAGPTGVQIL